MRSKKSKSTALLPRPKPSHTHLMVKQQELQQLYDKQAQLQLLQDKVNRSKPILSTIYDKIKQKQYRYEHKIHRLEKKSGFQKNLIKQYKDLYEEGVRIMHRNQLVDKFQGYSNYRNTKEGKQNDSKNNSTLCQQLKKQYRHNLLPGRTVVPSKTVDKIKEIYRGKSQSPMKKQLLYSRYRQKVDSDSHIKIKESSPQMKTKELSQKMLKQFDNDLVNLKKKDKERTGIKIIPVISSSSSSEYEIDENEQKRRYLQIQRQKLQSI